MKLETQAGKWFAEGIKFHRQFDRALKLTRQSGIDAAFNFLNARESIDHGQWGQFLELHAEEISPRQVRFYIQLAEAAIGWVKEAKPSLKKVSDLHAEAREMILQSPKPLVALCRELGHMRKFGEYDAVKYAQKKIGRQIEFDFAEVSQTLDLLSRLDEATLNLPDGLDRSEAIDELADKCEAAAKSLRAESQSLKTPLLNC